MGEHAWHKKAREELFQRQCPNTAYTSHSEISKLELFRVAPGERLSRAGCLSDADIVVFDGDSERITTIIEVESALNPKKVIGIVVATHSCNVCRIKKCNYRLEAVRLMIVFKKAKPGSKKDLKLTILKPILQEYIRRTEGCLSELEFTPHE